MRPKRARRTTCVSFCRPGRSSLSSTAPCLTPRACAACSSAAALDRQRHRLLRIDVLAGGDRLLQHGLALVGGGGVEEDGEGRIGQRLVEVGGPFRAVLFGDGLDALGIAAGQHQPRHDAVVAGRQAALVADRRQRVGEMLRAADAAGRAVEDDADGFCGHALSLSLPARAGQPHPAMMPRHIVCLTFDFDTQSGFIARGMTTPTPLSRGEFGATAAAPRILKFLKERGIWATWFTPGFTIESWPKESAAVADARPRDRASLLGAHPERQPEPRRGGGRSRPRQREYPEAHRPHRARLPLAVVGLEPAHHRPADQARLSLRLRA